MHTYLLYTTLTEELCSYHQSDENISRGHHVLVHRFRQNNPYWLLTNILTSILPIAAHSGRAV
jgi:hypothetical protein